MSVTCGLLLIIAQVCVAEQAKLTASDGQYWDLFGASVDMFQDRIVVGAENNRPPTIGTITGSAYVFELVGGSWQQMAQVAPSNAKPKGKFGRAVACDSLRLIVGAPEASTSIVGAKGLAYVYSKVGTGWIEEAILDPGEFALHFGAAVDIDGDTLLVGAPGHPSGSVYAYTRSGTTWNKQAKLQPSDNSATIDGWFGSSLLLRGDTAVVGAYRADGTAKTSGAVYIFVRTGTSWVESQKLIGSSGKTDDFFGISLALDSSVLVVGALGMGSPTNPWLTMHGGAYLFEWSGQQWQEKQRFIPKSYIWNDQMGMSVALHGEALMLGAPSAIFTPGFIHISSYANSAATEHVKVSSKDGWPVPGIPGGGGGVGWSLALNGSRLISGAPFAHGVGTNNEGGVYVFTVQMQNPAPTFYCSGKQDSKGCIPHFYHAGIPSVSGALGGQAYKLHCRNVLPRVPSMLFYSINGAANQPFVGGFLCLQQPLRGTQMLMTRSGGNGFPCSGLYDYDFNEWIASGNDPQLTVSQNVWMQYWYRDPTGIPGVNIGLSDAIHVTICP
jgi:hypothetical protein